MFGQITAKQSKAEQEIDGQRERETEGKKKKMDGTDTAIEGGRGRLARDLCSSRI